MVTATLDFNSIAESFCTHYYNLVNNGHDKLTGLYTETAQLSYTDLNDPFKTPEKVSGSDAIRAHWAKSQIAGSKIVIYTIDAQESIDKSILLITVGELATTPIDEDEDPPAHKFVQTFLLAPSGKSSYSIHNDYLRFIPDVDTEVVAKEFTADKEDAEEEDFVEVEVPDKSPSPAVKPAQAEESKPIIEASASAEKEVKKDNKPESEPVNAAVSIKDSEVGSASKTEESKEKGQEEIKKTATSSSSTPPTKAAASAPKHMSWAGLASASTSSTTSASTPTTATKSAENAKSSTKKNGDKPATSPSSAAASTASLSSSYSSKSASKKADDSDGFILASSYNNKKQQLQQKVSFTNKNGANVYPVYIKDRVSDITEKDLIAALERDFGKVDSCKISDAVALVDFLSADAQTKAISAGSAKVNSHTIRIEPRVAKPQNNGKDIKKKKQYENSSISSDGFKKVVR